jgi:type 1 glutamine amidotransferase
VLFVTQSKGYMHDVVRRPADTLSAAEIAVTQLGQQSGQFDVHCTQESQLDFTKENLQNYDVVMFYTTSGGLPKGETPAASSTHPRPDADLPIAESDLDYFFNDWLKQKGHGFIGFHSATDTYHLYQPYWDMIGGTFKAHPWSSRSRVTVTVHDTANPMMQPFGGEFEIRDEIYEYNNWQPEKVRVLASLNMEKCRPKMPYHVPVAWCKEYGQGRVYYNNLGHNDTTWTDKRFLASIENAIKWITGKVEADATPNPQASAEEEKKAKAAAGG